MAIKFGYIVPLRNDLVDMCLQVVDLYPNTSQRNSVLDGEGQTGYIRHMLDLPGPTFLNAAWTDYESGSRHTDPMDGNTNWPLLLIHTQEGEAILNNCAITQEAHYGLAAYLREHVCFQPNALNMTLTDNQSRNLAEVIMARAMGGLNLTLDDLNGLVADAHGTEFPTYTVQDILSILSGRVYKVPSDTILCDENEEWLDLPARKTLAQNATKKSTIFHYQGGFVENYEPAWLEAGPWRVESSAFIASATYGQLSKFSKDPVRIYNPNFAYDAGAVKPWKPRAYLLDGNPVPDDFTAPVLVCYTAEGKAV